MRAPIILLFTALLFVTSCKKAETKDTGIHSVKYTLQCLDCKVQYVKNDAGDTTTEYHRNFDWVYRFNGKNGQGLFLNATNTGTTYQDIRVTITIDDLGQYSTYKVGVDTGAVISVTDSLF